MKLSPALQKIVKTSAPEVRDFVAELQRENARLHRRVAKLEVERISSMNRISALEKEQKKGPVQQIQVRFVSPGGDTSQKTSS